MVTFYFYILLDYPQGDVQRYVFEIDLRCACEKRHRDDFIGLVNG